MASPKNPNQPSQSTFLPTDYVKGKTQTRANVLALILFGAVIIGVVGAFFLNNTRLQGVISRETEVDEQTRSAAEHLDQLKALRVQREGMIESAELVTALIERVPRSVLLAELVRDMPDDLVLTDIDLSGERVKAPAAPRGDTAGGKKKKRPSARSISNRVSVGKDAEKQEEPKVLPPRFKHRVVLTGLAAINNDVADYLAQLKDSPLFGAVELQYITETKVEDVDLRKFQISMNLLSDADVREVESAVETSLIDDAFDDLAPSLTAPPIETFGLAPTGEDGN